MKTKVLADFQICIGAPFIDNFVERFQTADLIKINNSPKIL